MRSEGVVACGTDAAEALLLTHQKPVHIELASDQLRLHVDLQQLQAVVVRCGELDVDRAVQEGFVAVLHQLDDLRHVAEIALGCDHLLHVVGGAKVHLVLVGGIGQDLFLLHRGSPARVDPQGDPILFTQVPQDRLLVGAAGVFPQRPHAAIGVAADKVIGVELPG